MSVLWRLAGVLPRSLTGVARASRRRPDQGIPPLQVGPRQIGEALFDEMILFGEAVRRETPDVGQVRRDVRGARGALAAGLAKATRKDIYPLPSPLQVVGNRRRRLGRTGYEEVEFLSNATLPAALRGVGTPTPGVVRLLRHEGDHRPWVVLVHGAEMGNVSDIRLLRARQLHRRLGVNVAMPVLPGHGPRARDHEDFPGLHPLLNLAQTIRAVHDVRSVVRWVAADQQPVSLVGLSLGGAVSALVASLEETVDRVAVVVPMIGMHQTLAYHLDRNGPVGRELAALLRSDEVRSLDRLIDPLGMDPRPARIDRLVVGATNDRMASVERVGALQRRWRGEVHWYHGGHVGPIFSPEVHNVVEEFLARQVDEAAPGVRTGRA